MCEKSNLSEYGKDVDLIMKKRSGYIVLAIVVVVIIALSVRNDFCFNENLRIKDCETLQRDSLKKEQMNSISISLNEVTAQLDSICREQKEYNRKEDLNNDTIKNSLSQIKMVGNQIHNLIK